MPNLSSLTNRSFFTLFGTNTFLFVFGMLVFLYDWTWATYFSWKNKSMEDFSYIVWEVTKDSYCRWQPRWSNFHHLLSLSTVSLSVHGRLVPATSQIKKKTGFLKLIEEMYSAIVTGFLWTRMVLVSRKVGNINEETILKSLWFIFFDFFFPCW